MTTNPTTPTQSPAPPAETDERMGCTSASNAAADLLCQGRHLAQQGLPQRRTPDSDSGEKIHKALAGDDVAFRALTGPERETFDACREIEKAKVAQFFGPDHQNIRVIREQRYWMKVADSNGKVYSHSGRLDVLFVAGKRGLVMEYKTLFGDVPESSKNLQLRDQAVLAAGNVRELEEIGAVVNQPFVTRTPEICLYQRAHLIQAEREMAPRIIASNDPSSPRVAGDLQCKFCLARRTCVEYQKFAGQLMPASMIQLLEVPAANWSPQQRATFLDRATVAQKWLDETKTAIKEGLKSDPNYAPGFTLKPGNIREVITNPQECFERFVKLGGSQAHFLTCITVQKSKLKTALSDATGAAGKALKTAMATLLSGIVEEKQNEPSIVRIDEA